MAKKQKEIITEDGHVFDSMEELYFYWWVKELMDNGYIKEFTSQPKSFELSEGFSIPYVKKMKKVADKQLSKTLIDSSVYTADGEIRWTKRALGLFISDLNSFGVNYFEDTICTDKTMLDLMMSHGSSCFIEVKPLFDQNNMTRLARTNIKWVWHNHGVFINLVIPQKLFEKTFTPKRFLTCNKSSAKRTIKFKTQSLQEFVGENKNNQTTLMQY